MSKEYFIMSITYHKNKLTLKRIGKTIRSEINVYINNILYNTYPSQKIAMLKGKLHIDNC